mgnify:CR=1 FL=1
MQYMRPLEDGWRLAHLNVALGYYLILSEFRGLRHIAGARSHGVKRGLGSVKDKDGQLKTGRQEVADAFADFYEALYASRREGAAQGGVSARTTKEVEKIDEEEVRAQLKKMASGKAADKGGVVAEMLKHGGGGVGEIAHGAL